MSTRPFYDALPESEQRWIVEPANDIVATRYRLDIVDQYQGRDGGIAWWGHLYCDGQRFCEVENRGDGGCNRYRFLDPALEAQFLTDAHIAYPNEIEPDECFVGLIDAMGSLPQMSG